MTTTWTTDGETRRTRASTERFSSRSALIECAACAGCAEAPCAGRISPAAHIRLAPRRRPISELQTGADAKLRRRQQLLSRDHARRTGRSVVRIWRSKCRLDPVVDISGRLVVED